MRYILLVATLLGGTVVVAAQNVPTSMSAEVKEGTSISAGPRENLPLGPKPNTKLEPLPTPTPMPAAQQSGYVRPDAETRRKRFVNATVGPVALGRQVATAGISTWRNSPEEWGTKWEGFGRRLASGLARNGIKQTAKFGLDEALKYDSHFYRSGNSFSVGTRLKRALISPVVAKDRNGSSVLGIPNLVGTYGSSIIAYETWYPKRYDWKDGLRSGTISLGFTAAFNVFKEFVWKK